MRAPDEIKVGPAWITELYDATELAEVTHYFSIEAGYVAMRTATAEAVREHRERKSA